MRLPAMTLLAQLLNDLRKYLNCPEATQQMGIYSQSCTLEIKNVFCRFSIVITLISIIFCPKPCSHSHVFPNFSWHARPSFQHVRVLTPKER